MRDSRHQGVLLQHRVGKMITKAEFFPSHSAIKALKDGKKKKKRLLAIWRGHPRKHRPFTVPQLNLIRVLQTEQENPDGSRVTHQAPRLQQPSASHFQPTTAQAQQQYLSTATVLLPSTAQPLVQDFTTTDCILATAPDSHKGLSCAPALKNAGHIE